MTMSVWGLTRLAVVAAILLLTSLTPVRAQNPDVRPSEPCTLRDGWTPTTQQLRTALVQHAVWLLKWYHRPLGNAYLERAKIPIGSWGREARRAILCNADLERVDLSGADLSGADLRHAYLSRANLSRANLIGADLTGAYLSYTNLSGANLIGANMIRANLTKANVSGANLSGADLSGANMSRADLSGADLRAANFSGAYLIGTVVAKARLSGADLADATYAPESEPPNSYVVGIKGLSTVKIPPGDDVGLTQLRKLLQDAGLRDDERLTTLIIERSTTSQRLANWKIPYALIEGVFRFVAFDVTTAYGSQPGRALVLILWFWVFFTAVYVWAIWEPSSRHATSGIFQVFPADRIDTTGGAPTTQKDTTVVKITEPGLGRALRSAAYFSLLSAFNIGFEAFNVGDWIRRVQAREYALQAVGWVRVVSGLQALLSLYLLAIWVLTYFGRPFQ